MLSSTGFDLWANEYDKSVNLSEEADEYPFAGYKNTLNEIYNIIHTTEKSVVLDIGFGTGVLTKKLYDDGYTIFGMDFSEKMIEIAKEKMPSAVLIQHDFTTGLPAEVSDKNFDFIISTYAIHHLNNDEKVVFIRQLLDRLNPRGKILIGDVAFETPAELESCRTSGGDKWDNDEIYLVLSDLKKHFPDAAFLKTSYCSGVVSFAK